MAYDPRIVEQLNAARAAAAGTGGTNTGVLKDYDTFAASLTGGSTGPLSPAPVAPTLPTPATAYKNFTAPALSEDDLLSDQLFKQTSRDVLAGVPKEKDVYRQKLALYQKEINANNQIYADMLRKAQVQGIGDFGSQRAIQARSGLLGSDFAASQNSGVADANAKRERLIQAEKSAALGAILGKVRSDVATELAAKRAAYDKGLTETRAFLAERATRRQNYAKSLATQMLDSNLKFEDIDPNQLNTIAKQYGLSTADLLTAYKAEEKTRKDALKKEAFDAAKEELEYDEATGTYKSTATPEGFELGEGQERYEYNADTGEYELIASGPEKVERGPGKYGEYEYGVANGYIDPSKTFDEWMEEGGGDADFTNKQKDTFDKLNVALTGLKEYRNLYDRLVTDRAGSQLSGDAAATLRSAHSTLMFQIAAAAGTGALQAPDREIVEKMIPDPTAPLGTFGRALRGGKSGGLTSIDKAIQMYENASEAIGKGPAGSGGDDGLSPEEQQYILDNGGDPGDGSISFSTVGNTRASTPRKGISLAPTFNLIKQEEGLRTNAYQDQTGKWTIGFGNTMINGRPVRPGDKISPKQALALMQKSVVNDYTTFKNKVKSAMTPNKFAALTSFEYNLGPGVWQQPTGRQILSAINQKRYDIAGRLMLQFNKSHDPGSGQLKVNPVLAKRRQREAKLLLS